MCGSCSGHADVRSYADGRASERPKCPQCNLTVTHRVKLVVHNSQFDFDYKWLCALNDDCMHRFVHGRWRNANVRFRVSYPLITDSVAAVREYREKSEETLRKQTSDYMTLW